MRERGVAAPLQKSINDLEEQNAALKAEVERLRTLLSETYQRLWELWMDNCPDVQARLLKIAHYIEPDKVQGTEPKETDDELPSG